MSNLAVIIPYFQRQPGILRRALDSIVKQRVLTGARIDIIVADDGSPSPARLDTAGLVIAPPFHLKLIEQANGGVGAARNAGLRAVASDIDYIAFLDSDDSWDQGYLESGLAALDAGNDFYFCDSRRPGMHASSFASGDGLILPFIRNMNDLGTLTRDELLTLILKCLPCHISATIYRKSIAPDLYFNTAIRTAGEDMIYLMHVVTQSRVICFSPKILVECGSGVNIFFGSMGWDSAGLIGTIIDKLRTHRTIKRFIALPEEAMRWNERKIASLKRNLAFHTLRRFITSKGKFPPEVAALAREDVLSFLWFPWYALEAYGGRALGLFRPE